MIRKFRILLLNILLPVCVLAQMIPDAPISDFRLPLFGDDGYKIWELRGLEGHYLRDGEARVDGMDLLVFSGDESMRLEHRIRSPEAEIDFNRARARGSSSLFMTGDGFEIEGADWIWEGERKMLSVARDVRVVFEQKLLILQ